VTFLQRLASKKSSRGGVGKKFLSLIVKRANTDRRILHHLDGYVKDGEMLAVLGRSGSGCTTLLKVLAGAAPDLQLSQESNIQYQGVENNHSAVALLKIT
jgi:ABC-type multidrug transport system ATPase subunit